LKARLKGRLTARLEGRLTTGLRARLKGRLTARLEGRLTTRAWHVTRRCGWHLDTTTFKKYLVLCSTHHRHDHIAVTFVITMITYVCVLGTTAYNNCLPKICVRIIVAQSDFLLFCLGCLGGLSALGRGGFGLACSSHCYTSTLYSGCTTILILGARITVRAFSSTVEIEVAFVTISRRIGPPKASSSHSVGLLSEEAKEDADDSGSVRQQLHFLLMCPVSMKTEK
jgi:hypothetical protein